MAEEHVVTFFARGGVPKAMIFVEGGVLAKGVAEQIQNLVNRESKDVAPVAVVPVENVEFGVGDKESRSTVKVTVERFGDVLASSDAIESYDERAALRVRSAFRLPPLFFGITRDQYNYATAQASYIVTEAQVFRPARDTFDDRMNSTIVMTVVAQMVGDTEERLEETYRYRSLPLEAPAIDDKLEGVGILADKAVITKGELARLINTVTGTDAKVADGQEDILAIEIAMTSEDGDEGETDPDDGEGGDDLEKGDEGEAILDAGFAGLLGAVAGCSHK